MGIVGLSATPAAAAGSPATSSRVHHAPEASFDQSSTAQHVAAAPLRWLEYARGRLDSFQTWYHSRLPPVRLRSYQDIVLRLVVIKVECSLWLRAMQSLRRENPNGFTARALLVLCAVALLGNSLGTFVVVYLLTFGALLAPPFVLYNVPGRVSKQTRILLPSMLLAWRDRQPTPSGPTSGGLEEPATSSGGSPPTAHPDVPAAPTLLSLREDAGTVQQAPKITDLSSEERQFLTTSSPVGLRPEQAFLSHFRRSTEDGSSIGHRVLLPGLRAEAATSSGNLVPALDLPGTFAPPLPEKKSSSPSQFIGFLKRNLSGALKQKSSATPPDFGTKSGLKKAQRRTIQLDPSPVDPSRFTRTEFEPEEDSEEHDAVSFSLHPPRRATKRRRSGSIEPMMLATSGEISGSGSASQIAEPVDALHSVPSSPVLSPRLNSIDDEDPRQFRSKVPRIPLILLRGSRDDSVIQSPRHRP